MSTYKGQRIKVYQSTYEVYQSQPTYIRIIIGKGVSVKVTSLATVNIMSQVLTY